MRNISYTHRHILQSASSSYATQRERRENQFPKCIYSKNMNVKKHFLGKYQS